jgi:hypothetical protein
MTVWASVGLGDQQNFAVYFFSVTDCTLVHDVVLWHKVAKVNKIFFGSLSKFIFCRTRLALSKQENFFSSKQTFFRVHSLTTTFNTWTLTHLSDPFALQFRTTQRPKCSRRFYLDFNWTCPIIRFYRTGRRAKHLLGMMFLLFSSSTAATRKNLQPLMWWNSICPKADPLTCCQCWDSLWMINRDSISSKEKRILSRWDRSTICPWFFRHSPTTNLDWKQASRL